MVVHSVAGPVDPSGAHRFNTIFWWVSCSLIFSPMGNVLSHRHCYFRHDFICNRIYLLNTLVTDCSEHTLSIGK